MAAAAAAMASVMVLLVAVQLFHLPASATLNPVGGLFAKANNASSSSSAAAAAASVSSAAPAPSAVNGGEKKPEAQQAAATAAAAPANEAKAERDKNEMAEIEKEKQEAAAKGHLVSLATDGTGAYKGMTHDFLAGHNALRKRYGVPAMRWNTKLARHARRWSNAMRKDCEAKHSSGSNYGENVYVSRDTWNATAKDALWTWTDEERLYDRRTGNCTAGHHYRECGHFKNMVAEKNQKIGCARGECYKGGVFISCNYYVGNFDP